MPDERTAASLAFGRFTLQPPERRLLLDGREVTVGPRAFDVLVVLVERAGQLVRKEELLARAWPNLVVEENNLQVQVSALRKILGQDAIATVPGRGYRFTVSLSAASTARQANLPRPLTSFIGRESELAEYAALLQQTRLLTLTGIGGSGKTRLAIELAQRAAPGFRDGVRYVDLASVSDPERVPLAVSAALGVREERDEPVEETLARTIGDRQVLLTLDNCEHLLGACATLLERLLVTSPAVRALVTSREGLGIPGERVVPVRSMTMPPREAMDPGAIAGFEAIRLFVDRAKQAAPEFELNAANVAAVVDICRRLDGIPLAIELAAARVRMLSLERILAKLDDRFRLLTGSARAIPRHQTLLATLHWSYEHLAQGEQQALRRLSVFAGGWTLPAAVAVVDEGIDEIECVERLSRLVDKSLVLVERSAEGDPRYGMLETVREYAQERLAEAGERDAARQRHLDWFLCVAQDALPNFFTPRAKEMNQAIACELPNLLAAHHRCEHLEGGGAKGLELASALRTFWLNRGLFALGQQVYDEALARTGAGTGGMRRAKALFAMAQHRYFRGRFAAALPPAEEALAIAREHGDDEWAAYCLQCIARARCWIDDSGRAAAAAEEALALARRVGSARLVAVASTAMGEIRRAHGDFSGAAEAYEQALEPFRDDPWNISAGLCFFALACVECGDFARATDAIVRSVRKALELGTSYGSIALWAGARLAAAQGEWRRAARLQGAFDSATSTMGGTPNAWDDRASAALREKPRAMLGEQAWAQAYESGKALSLRDALGELLEWLEPAVHEGGSRCAANDARSEGKRDRTRARTRCKRPGAG